MPDSPLRRKIARQRPDAEEGRPGADRAFRLALARAARDEVKLALDTADLSLALSGLGEVLEKVGDQALILLLDGPEERIGLLVLSNGLMTGLVEALTIGLIREGDPGPRRPTRTDAAILAGLVDHFLSGMETVLEAEPDLAWVGGYRYASFLEEARPLGLLLEDAPYRRLTARVSLSGRREGQVLLALLDRQVAPHAGHAPGGAAAPEGADFPKAMEAQVQAAEVRMDAVIDRLHLPIAEVMALEAGLILRLPRAAIDRISLEGVDARRIATGKLGQNRGFRALRLTDIAMGAAGFSADPKTDGGTTGPPSQAAGTGLRLAG